MSITGPLTVAKKGDVTVVVFGPEQRQLDELNLNLEQIGRQLVDAAQTANPPQLVLDMTTTEFFGSSFIEILLRVWKKLDAQPGGKFAISGLQPYCKEVLEVTHLDRLWPLPASSDEAVAAFNADSPTKSTSG